MEANEKLGINRIINSELVVQHFGYWPRFHDATLERITFEVHSHKTSVTFSIATAEFTHEVDEQGHYKLFKPCTIELQFDNVRNTALVFDHVLVFFDVVFEERDDAIDCSFSSSAGSHTIVAEQVTVLSLIPTAR
ncbi:Imm50 family immunity protein [Hymenobacter cavernae]|uniref:Uncharacterized protein n=1 Tax=Hymenobacter cavernae TaxID=2044852 RepID=A0ABQ1TQE8_9BACT|nr:Imm50 family immunity protein [Hymenobacter cavernae]GGF00823.1 hypothetical protein GCM10011383_09550 [Hymenobacter cavernae]